jgi:exonuclease III
VVVGDFNTPLSSIDRSSKQKLNKEIQDLKYAIDQVDLVDVYRTFHPTSTQYTFFSAAHGTFSKLDHILAHKASLSKYKKIETKADTLKATEANRKGDQELEKR